MVEIPEANEHEQVQESKEAWLQSQMPDVEIHYEPKDENDVEDQPQVTLDAVKLEASLVSRAAVWRKQADVAAAAALERRRMFESSLGPNHSNIVTPV